jgi:hypothetical protein
MNHAFDNAPASFGEVLEKNLPASLHIGGKFENSSYSKLLTGPISNIASNVPERSDASSAALLGYN